MLRGVAVQVIDAGQLQHDVAEAASEAEMLALNVSAPAQVIRTDLVPPHIFFLKADPASTLSNWVDAGPIGSTGENPTVTVGLTAKNGAAETYMRSDAAPALDQGIAPTWTGAHTFVLAPRAIVPTDGNKLWLAKYQAGSGHTDAPKTLGAASTYLQIGGREYGSAGFAGVGFGYVADPTQNPPVWVGHEEDDTGGNTTGDFVVATRSVTTNTPPVEQLRVTKLGAVAFGGKANVGVAKQVLTSTGPATAPAWEAPQAPIVAADGKTNQNADINMPALYAVPVSGMYRVSACMVQTVAATTSSTLPSLNVQYTEATTGVGMSDQLMTSSSLNQVGAHQNGSAVILAQQGSSIGYVTGNYASAGATAMRYAVQLKIEFLG